MRNAICLAGLVGLMAVPATRGVVLFHDNFESAVATQYTLKQQLTNTSLQTDSDPVNTVGAADSVTPGKWFHYRKSGTPAYDIQVSSNLDTLADLNPYATGSYTNSYEGNNFLRLRRSKEPPSSTAAIGACFAEQTSGVVRAKWKMMIPDQQFGIEGGITFPAQFFFTPWADNDHTEGVNGAQTPVTFINSGMQTPPQYLRCGINGAPFTGNGSILFENATDPTVEVNKWQDYTIEANLDTQTYTITVDGETTSAVPFNFTGPMDTFSFRVGQAAAPWDDTITATYFVDDLLIEKVAPKWKVDSNGNWSDSANWDLSVPNAIGAVAEFSSAITQPRTVTVDAPVTVGQIYLSNTQAYTISGSSTITLQTSAGLANINVGTGSHVISAPVVFASSGTIDGAGTLTLGNVTSNGSLTMATRVFAGNIDGTGSLLVSPGKLLDATRVRQDVITVNGTLTISGARNSAKTSRARNLVIDSLGHVDLGQNDLVVSSTGTSSVNTIRGQITSGYANGAWTGFGLMSSSAGLGGGIMRALGYADNAQLGLTTFGDQSVDSTSVLVRYTVAGDADLNGTVNSLDFNRLSGGYGITSNAYWLEGDFNYDQKVNTLDFNLLAGGFSQTIPAPTLGAVVPEPTGLALLAVAGVVMRRRAR